MTQLHISIQIDICMTLLASETVEHDFHSTINELLIPTGNDSSQLTPFVLFMVDILSGEKKLIFK